MNAVNYGPIRPNLHLFHSSFRGYKEHVVKHQCGRIMAQFGQIPVLNWFFVHIFTYKDMEPQPGNLSPVSSQSFPHISKANSFIHYLEVIGSIEVSIQLLILAEFGQIPTFPPEIQPNLHFFVHPLEAIGSMR
jgi:hypothetical protein